MEIRELREEDREAAFYVGSQAFMGGSRDISRVNATDQTPRRNFGLWDAAGLQALTTVIDFRIHLGAEATVPMGGIANVACLPASRGKGYAGECLKYVLERMREAASASPRSFRLALTTTSASAGYGPASNAPTR